MSIGTATVKAVLSGDTVLLVGRPVGGPPPELQLSFSGLLAPRLGNAQRGSADEPFAWQSREFLRRLCIGKQVQFKVEYSVAQINRKFGVVKMKGKSLGQAVAQAGWAKVKPATGDVGEEHETLVELGQSAENAKLGMFAERGADTIRQAETAIEDPAAFAAEVKDQPLEAIVEWVRDGSSVKCYLPSKHATVMIQMAGIACPRLRPRQPAADAEGSSKTEASSGPEPFSREAKHFLEVRVLHRDVLVRIHAADRNNTYFGTIEHPAGDIREHLVRQGFAQVVDWSIHCLPMARAAALRKLEREAKTAKKRVWKNYVAPVIEGDKEFAGTVAEVVSGDTIVVLVGDKNAAPGTRTARRVSLSSVRVPRLGRRGEAGEPFALQSKEFMRKLLIGREVAVSIEYTRQPQLQEGQKATAPRRERFFGTVHAKMNNRNVAEMLLEAGLGETVRHRQGDERSQFYDNLLQAEAQAKERKKGKHSARDVVERKRVDLTSNAKHATEHLSFLRKPKVHKAIVEYIANASRFRVHVSKEMCDFNFLLAGIRTPANARPALAARDGRPAREATPAEPFGEEALAYVRENLLQRVVEIEIDDVNRGGAAIGTLRVIKGARREPLAVDLLRRGFAKTTYSASRLSSYDELIAAEAEAKEAELNVWQNWREEEAAAARAEAKEAEKVAFSVQYESVVSHIESVGHVWLQHCDEASSADMRRIEEGIAACDPESLANPGEDLALHSFCLAPFEEANGISWFRGRVERISEDASEDVLILFVDHGNRAEVSRNQLRAIPAELLEIPPQAHECHLAFLRSPAPEDEFYGIAGHALADMVFGQRVVAKVHWQDKNDGVLHATLFSPDQPDSDSVSEKLVARGLARVHKYARKDATDANARELVTTLKGAENAARDGHVGMWRFGDADYSDDEAPVLPAKR